MRRISQAFPNWYEASSNQADELWDTEGSLASPEFLETAMTLLENELVDTWPSNAEQVRASANGVTVDTAVRGPSVFAFAADSLSVETTIIVSPEDVPRSLAFLRLFAVLPPLELAIQLGDRGDAYDWLMCALDDRSFARLEPKKHVEVGDWNGRLRMFLSQKHPIIATHAPQTVLRWATAAYFVARRFGAPQELMLEAAHLVVNLASELATSGDPRDQSLVIGALAQVSSWASEASHEGIAVFCARKIVSLVDSGALPGELEDLANLALSTKIGAAAGLDPSSRAEASLDGVRANAKRTSFMTVSLMTSARRERDADGMNPVFMESVAAAAREARATTFGDRLAFAVLQAKRYDQIIPAVVRQLDQAHVADAIQLVGKWFGNDLVRSTPALSCSPATPTGTQYAFERRTWTLPRKSDPDALAYVTHVSDRALGSSTTVLQELERGNPVVDEALFRNAASAREFESALRDFYSLADLSARLQVEADDADALFMPQAFQHPIQALLLDALGRSYPLIASFEPPAPDRSLRKALVWTAGTTTGSMETAVVVSSLRKAGLEVDDYSDQELDCPGFLDLYANPAYDLLWLVGHGEFSGAHPAEGTIQIDWSGGVVSLKDLANIELSSNDGGRRLLVLNLCESGIAMQAPAPPTIGFGPSLANGKQAVIGHLWPVQNLPAAFFGAALSETLMLRHGFFPSFERALGRLRATQAEAADWLSALGPEGTTLADRLRAQLTDEFTARGILTWGSPVFYE